MVQIPSVEVDLSVTFGADVVYSWRGEDASGRVDSLRKVHGLRSTSAVLGSLRIRVAS